MAISFGRYELLRRMAAGGMGEVYLARQAGLEGFEKVLVVKVLLPHLVESEEFIRMFLDEARIAARLNHANIAQIFDLGEVDGAWYIAMEYIHGDDVKRIWKKADQEKKPVPLPLAVRIAADAAAGLDYAHKASDGDGTPLGIVHRDVSPQNILVSFEGGVKVIDFGVAKATNKSVQTATGTLKGKYPYMSPEQARGKPIDHRSDVFALGVVLFEMATGQRLFHRENEIAILNAVTECEIPKPSSVNPAIDAHLEGVMLQALAPTPEARFPDAQTFRLALEDWLTQTRQAGSAAHLGAYLQDLFADRLAEEKVQGRPVTEGERTPSGVHGPLALLRGPGTPTGAQHAAGQAATQDATAVMRPKPQPTPQPQNDKPRLWAPLLGALLVGGAIGGFLFWPGGGEDAPPRPETDRVAVDDSAVEADPAPPDPAAVAPRIAGEPEALPDAPPEEPPPADEIALEIKSRPAGATVLLGGEALGTTPLVHRHPRSDETVQLQFRLPGHVPVRRSVSASSDGEVMAVLRRATPQPAAEEDDPLDIKTGR
jgi:serine/threonine protein kinase